MMNIHNNKQRLHLLVYNFEIKEKQIILVNCWNKSSLIEIIVKLKFLPATLPAGGGG